MTDEGKDNQVPTETERTRPRKSARDKIMDYLARRMHSELELRQKLSEHYTPADVDNAVQYAYDNNWMLPPEEISERVKIELERKNKGANFINRYLREKGLPAVSPDTDDEIQRARKLAASCSGHAPPFEFTEQKKIFRYLQNRGFADEIIRKVIYEKS